MNGLLKRICKLVLVEGKEERIARTHTTPQTSAENPGVSDWLEAPAKNGPYGFPSNTLWSLLMWLTLVDGMALLGWIMCGSRTQKSATLGLLIYSCRVKMGKGG